MSHSPASYGAVQAREGQHHGFLPALQSLLTIIVIAVFIITLAIQPFRIPSESMEPTLLVGDFLLVDKQNVGWQTGLNPFPSTNIRRGDIIVFHYPIDPSIHLIKRVIGLPGDHLKLREGHVYINGQALIEPYAIYRPSSPDNFRDNFPRLQMADPEIDSRWWVRMHTLIDNGELVIPAGNYFVLGDNRNDSEDSRYWGFVPSENIVGRPILIYFSLRSINANEPGGPRTLDHPPSSMLESVLGFARWDRTLSIVR